MTAIRAEQFGAPVAGLGEGPLWDDQIGALRAVDLLRGDILTFDADGRADRTHVGTVATVIRARSAGYVIGVEHGIARFDADLRPAGDPVLAFDTDGLRMNDGGCDPQGRFYVGSMAYDEREGAGTLYRFDPDGSATPVLAPVTISNGIQWSSDGSRVFYNDTPTRRVAVFDFDAADGTLTGGRDFVRLPDDLPGNPDGMAIDAEDGIWIALWGGSAVHRYDRDGRLSAVVEVPAGKVTCPTFGGPDRDRLYITTASLETSAEDEPGAGAVFVAEPGVRGLVPHRFAG